MSESTHDLRFETALAGERSPDDAPRDLSVDRRLAIRAFLILDTLFIGVMSVFAFLAPCGRWTNKIFGISIWDHSDPGGPYVVSALSFFKSDYPPYVGGAHPGTTLQFLIALMAESIFGVAKLFGSSADYLGFWAKHVTLLFALSSVLMAVMHVVSFHLLYVYAKRLLGSTRLALIAVIAYATCFPTLYYGTRVSTEPLLICLTLLTFLSLDDVAVALANRRRLAALCPACIAGAASMAAVYTKLHLAAPLPLLVIVQLILQTRPDHAALTRRVKDSALPVIAAVVAMTATFLLGLLKVHWETFFDFWRKYTPGKAPRNRDLSLLQQYTTELGTMAAGTARALVDNVVLHLSRTYQGLFTLADGLFVVGAIVGTVLIWRKYPHVRERIVWPILLCISLMPILVFRGVWHYYVLHLAFGAIGFAVALRWLAERWMDVRGKRDFRMAVAATLLIHTFAFAFFAAAKLNDVKSYRSQFAMPLDAVHQIPYRTYLVVLTGEKPPNWLRNPWTLYGGYPQYVAVKSTPFVTTFARQFRYVSEPAQLTRANIRKWKASYVLDLRGPKPVLLSTRHWKSPARRPATRPTSAPATLPTTVPVTLQTTLPATRPAP